LLRKARSAADFDAPPHAYDKGIRFSLQLLIKKYAALTDLWAAVDKRSQPTPGNSENAS